MSPKEQIPWDDDDQLFAEADDPVDEEPEQRKSLEDQSAADDQPKVLVLPPATPSADAEASEALPSAPAFEPSPASGETAETPDEEESGGGRYAWEDKVAAPVLLTRDQPSALDEVGEDDSYSEDESYSEEDFEDEAEQALATGASQKIGIVGGKGVGKSYLFQAMVYRAAAGKKAGALAYYLEKDAIRLFSALQRDSTARTMNLVRFVKKFQSWRRLEQTTLITQRWYRLELPYRTGLLGGRRAALEVEFFDGSGEIMQIERGRANNKLWQEGYLDARVMVFCLPIWVAFPDSGLSPEDWQIRDEALEGFEQVVQNYIDLRASKKRQEPVQTILALTMADDRRSALKTLRDRWMAPYMDSPETYLRQLRTGAGVARYLANAQHVSAALHEEFTSVAEPTVSGIPQKLDFGAGEPWIVPLSAIEGEFLDTLDEQYPGNVERPRLSPPVPVHVELPLLVALCERSNALM